MPKSQKVVSLRSNAVTEPAADLRELQLESGRRIEIQEGAQDELTVRAPTGLLEIKIRFTAEGPVMEMAASQIQLRTDGALTMDCDTFNVRARSAISLETQGALVEHVRGDHTMQVEGTSRTEARQVRVEATDGDIEVDAKHDVWIDSGDRVMINS